MYADSHRRYVVAGVIAASLLTGSSIPIRGQTPAGTNPPLELRLVRTIDPADLRLSDRDRLSGGLPLGVPFRMATDSQGRILITDPHLSLIQVLDIEGGKRYQLKGDRIQKTVFPTYIAVDADDYIYVSAPVLGGVLEFFPDGRFMRIIGGDELALPFGLAIDKAGHRLFVVDHKQADVVVYSEEGKFLKRIGGFGAGAGEFNRPTEIAYENGMLYVLDSGNARFEAFDSDGQYEAMLPFGDSRLPMAFTVDTAGRLYCVDGFSLGVLVLDATGDTLTTYGVRRPYGQPAPADQSPTYKSLIRRADGAVLGLRADLTVDVLELNVSDVKVTAEESGNR